MQGLFIQVCSDLDYEGMVVDICDEKGRIATISCDRGIENTQIVLYDKKHEKPIWSLDYFSFMKILSESLDRLKEANALD
ncbi:MAG: hypothetical protein WAM28_02980 [Chlamydiales bacterium]